ncbi:TIR domain-containing protein [Rhodococcus sp. UNC363MFTsu5.1]|uniref:TIR domain-containing protein n=1 Tax=Rhodococcus sp. UNC363MFTsu5.1 TaxID=1449069 RepID=UPI000691D401|nr:TIR domain-containing protein [Rhodococcus sp. UNC363MFTsu5.1]
MDASEDAADYEFDIAVSFAGENRQYVEDVVRKLDADGIRVFYDADYRYDSWGEDGVEFFTKVYMERARYVAMFISRHYADKEWTRLERRTALARALTQRSAYILPIRLDDTTLDGLLPTVGYLEATREGIDGIAAAVAYKMGSPRAQALASYEARVATTPAELQELLRMRPASWEILAFASIIEQGRDKLSAERRDHEMEYAPRSGRTLDADEAMRRMRSIDIEVSNLGKSFMKVLDPAVTRAAFGAPPGENGEPAVPGDPDRILHIGQRLTDVYKQFLDLAAELRGLTVPQEYSTAYEIAARLTNEPLRGLDAFVDEYVDTARTIPGRIATGEQVTIEMRAPIAFSEELLDELIEELLRVQALSQ